MPLADSQKKAKIYSVFLYPVYRSLSSILGSRKSTRVLFIYFFFQENFIWKTSILKRRTIKSLKEEEIPSGTMLLLILEYR